MLPGIGEGFLGVDKNQLPSDQVSGIFTPRAHARARVITPRAHARARGYVIGRGVYILLYIISLHFFWNQSFISQNTHFQRSILTEIGFSSNLMASGTA